MTHHYFIRLAFDGTNYHGWQVQKNTSKTVQYTLNQAFTTVLREECFLNGCGRTDTGVHARDFYADLQIKSDALEVNREKIKFKLNHLLPDDITILDILKVKPLSNARFAAERRTYEYLITTSKDPFLHNKALQIHDKPDLAKMKKAAARLKHHRDFAAFCRTGGGQKTTLCKIYKADWSKKGNLYIFKITADRFLRNMVRALVGTMLEVGRGKVSLSEWEEIIQGKDRRNAGKSALACGLYLLEVKYPKKIFV